MRTGYKEMLRDRCPLVVDYALKCCKAKGRWIDHVYKSFIGFYSDKNERVNATRKSLGIVKGKPRLFDFHSTIDWDNLDDDETQYWEYVEAWVEWFKHSFDSIARFYHSEIQHVGREESEVLKDIHQLYLRDLHKISTISFILKCVKNYPNRL